MPELKDEGKKPEDQTKALVVSVKDGYDWSAYAEQFTSDLTSGLALVCEIEEDWSEEGDGKMTKDVSEDSEEYDWSAKSDPVEESESEIALMATSKEDGVTTEADDEASNKSEPVLIQLVEYPELNPKPETVKDEGEFSGYNDPEYIRWKKEQKAQVADQLIKKQEVKKVEVSTAKKQKSKVLQFL
ncbi:hypothetical protein QVD17_00086 [Tagetes erecta]|uniref:Uncharacterized protein n=1 Tax=Tagetes erecta TaxID=13708 RepID=A0AAD8L3Y5_TARER|nr:hypothetical protein QVD17_00086 [Tagetes erecta]